MNMTWLSHPSKAQKDKTQLESQLSSKVRSSTAIKHEATTAPLHIMFIVQEQLELLDRQGLIVLMRVTEDR